MDKALDGSQKRKKRKVLDKSRDFVRITHRVVYRAETKTGQSTQQVEKLRPHPGKEYINKNKESSFEECNITRGWSIGSGIVIRKGNINVKTVYNPTG